MNDTPKAHQPCPFCGEADTGRFTVMGWPTPGAPDWLVVACGMCQAQGPAVPRLKGESRRQWVAGTWEIWDERCEPRNGPSTVDDDDSDREGTDR